VPPPPRTSADAASPGSSPRRATAPPGSSPGSSPRAAAASPHAATALDSSAAAATAAFALRFTALEERCGRVEAAAQAAVQAADARAQAAEARAVAAEAALRGAPTHLLTRAQSGAGTPPPAASPVDGKLAETVASLVTWRSEFEANVVRVFYGLRETVAAEAAAQSSKLDALAALVRPLAEAAAAARPPGFVAERAAALNASTLRASAAPPSVAMRSPLP
jgi:hypothetical protein